MIRSFSCLLSYRLVDFGAFSGHLLCYFPSRSKSGILLMVIHPANGMHGTTVRMCKPLSASSTHCGVHVTHRNHRHGTHGTAMEIWPFKVLVLFSRLYLGRPHKNRHYFGPTQANHSKFSPHTDERVVIATAENILSCFARSLENVNQNVHFLSI